MVLLAAAVTTRSGKPIVSRQFIEMQKARIEGLLASFPKLMSSGKQHTFVETESVRFVYQPLDQLYVVLITTKASNILEDLETLRLFTRVVPECCGSLTESDVFDAAFNLIFAFDEIVAMGYRESVTLSQVCTFVEMDSHEEKVYQAVRQTQEREAKQKMREKAKELQRQKYDTQKRGGGGGSGMGFGADSGSSSAFGGSQYGASSAADSRRQVALGSSAAVGADGTGSVGGVQQMTIRATGGSGKALKLGKKSRDVDTFVDQLKSEGEQVANTATKRTTSSLTGRSAAPPSTSSEPLQLTVVEVLRLSAHRSGGLQQLELQGQAMLRCCDPQLGCVQLHVSDACNNQQLLQLLQLQTHPQLDKQAFRSQNMLRLKHADKPFPVNVDVGVLRWRLQSTDESLVPLTLNCWPSENTDSGCDVNIEYTLENKALSLSDLIISVPVVRGVGEPVVSECDGSCTVDSRHSKLVWSVPLVDSDNSTGTLEFSCGGRPADFFPVTVSFTCTGQTMSGLSVDSVSKLDDGEPVGFSVNSSLVPEKFEIV